MSHLGFEKIFLAMSKHKYLERRKEEMLKKNLNFLEMLICLCKQTNKQKRERHEDLKNISGELEYSM